MLLRLLLLFFASLLAACGGGGGSSESEPALPIAASQLTASPASCSQINLAWQVGANTEALSLYRDGSLIKTFAKSTASYQDKSLNENRSYSYHLKSSNSDGSVNSITVSATTETCYTPVLPTPVSQFTASAVGCDQVDLSWQVGANTQSLALYRNGNKLADLSASTTSFQNGGLNEGTDYSYSLTSTNVDGSVSSSVVSVTTGTCQPLEELTCVETYDWPTGQGEALLSDRYSVTLTQDGKTIPVEVIKSVSKDIEMSSPSDSFMHEWMATSAGEERTFNWASFSSNFCSPITVTVTKLFGEGTDDVEIAPTPYGITPTVSADGKSVSFTLDQQKYVAVNFKVNDNKQTSDGAVRHMFMLFADPEETDVPDVNDSGVHVYSETSTQQQMRDANTIYFPPGWHDLGRLYHDTSVKTLGGDWTSQTVSNMGPAMKDGKQVYFAGGAYVHGRIYASGINNAKIYGRGVLSGRDFKWAKKLSINGGVLGVDSYHQQKALIGLGGLNNTIEGVAVCDSAGHGVNLGSGYGRYQNFKIWGWHPNNDGARPWGTNKPNIIDKSFFHVVDDALYNKSLVVTETIFWHGFNGGILTLGWDGNYDTEGSSFINNYIIYPEWRNIGNNNGLVMSQLDFDMTGKDVLIRNLHVDGNIPALVNLKNSSSKTSSSDKALDNQHNNRKTVGEIRGIHLENITVTGKQVIFDGSGFNQTEKPSKSLIQGTQLTDGNGTYKISDVSFTNVTLNGECLTDANKASHVAIERDAFGVGTTENIAFNGCITSHELTVTVGTGGGVSPNVASMEIAEGSSQAFTFTPEPGKSVKNVTVDGVSLGAKNSHTFSNVKADHQISVEFE